MLLRGAARCRSLRHRPASAALLGRRALLSTGAASVPAAAGAVALLVLAATSARAAAASTGMDARSLASRGMQLFRSRDVAGSLAAFDAALALDPSSAPYLWQRGLSLYYAERWEDGASQFRLNVSVNPNDTEESIWALLCEARLHGFDEARRRLLVVGVDSRPVMRAAYAAFSGAGSLEALVQAGTASGAPHDAFYSLLYQGLYHEARGEAEAARAAVLAAVATPYGRGSNDYMASLAGVHAAERGWAAAA